MIGSYDNAIGFYGKVGLDRASSTIETDAAFRERILVEARRGHPSGPYIFATGADLDAIGLCYGLKRDGAPVIPPLMPLAAAPAAPVAPHEPPLSKATKSIIDDWMRAAP